MSAITGRDRWPLVETAGLEASVAVGRMDALTSG